MNDHHMHHPDDFDPDKPRERGDDGMVCYPGLRSDCPLCLERATAPDKKKPATKAAA